VGAAVGEENDFGGDTGRRGVARVEDDDGHGGQGRGAGRSRCDDRYSLQQGEGVTGGQGLRGQVGAGVEQNRPALGLLLPENFVDCILNRSDAAGRGGGGS
jgi:hypothetical protein